MEGRNYLIRELRKIGSSVILLVKQFLYELNWGSLLLPWVAALHQGESVQIDLYLVAYLDMLDPGHTSLWITLPGKGFSENSNLRPSSVPLLCTPPCQPRPWSAWFHLWLHLYLGASPVWLGDEVTIEKECEVIGSGEKGCRMWISQLGNRTCNSSKKE